MADLIQAFGGYRFQGLERRMWNLFPTVDEKWAYLDFAREKHDVENQRVAGDPLLTSIYPGKGYEIMKEWKALSDDERDERIQAGRTDPNRPDAVDIHVEFEGPDELDSPGSINDWADVNTDAGMAPFRALTWRFVKTLYKRHYREVHASQDGLWSVVRLYVGIDATNRVRDVSTPIC